MRPAVERLTFDDVADRWPVPDAGSDKYSRGVVGIVAGSVAYPGAALLSVLGALGAGPGMIRYLGPRDVQWLVHQAAPEVVTAPGRVQAWVVGSGFDVSTGDDETQDAAQQRQRALDALASDLPVLVDAGALELVDRREAPTLLTPHAGELARLLTRLGVTVGEGGGSGGEVTREQVTRAPLAHARAAARRTGCTVLLKGATTLVVDPDEAVPVRSQHDAPAWVATAGAGRRARRPVRHPARRRALAARGGQPGRPGARGRRRPRQRRWPPAHPRRGPGGRAGGEVPPDPLTPLLPVSAFRTRETLHSRGHGAPE